jgi:mevalonate kinase
MLVKASAPGSLMVLGEYAVLYGQPALVCAVDKRITVSLTPRTDQAIQIHSALGKLTVLLPELQITAPFQFVTAVLKNFQTKIPIGCDINIEAEFAANIGFGSSAAVTVATLLAITRWLDLTFSTEELITTARNIIQIVQGTGSGADVAASVLGGMVAYQMQPLQAEKISFNQPLTAVYAGYKTPTVTAINKVQTAFAQQPELFTVLCKAIGTCAIQGLQAVRNEDWTALGKVMDVQHGLLQALGVVTTDLNDITERLRAVDSIHGAKISGAGLGDCILGLGILADKNIPASFQTNNTPVIALSVGQEGARCEKI